MPAFKKVKKHTLVTKCTPEVIDNICKVLRIGAYPETAAVMAGVSKEVFLDWMKKAHPEKKGHRKIYTQLLHAVRKAIEECTARDLMNIDTCAMGKKVKFLKDDRGNLILDYKGDPITEEYGLRADWHASAWRLERRAKGFSGPKNEPPPQQSNTPQIIITLPDNGRGVKSTDEENK